MRLWLFQFGQRYDATRSANDIYRDLLDEGAFAEELGFEGVFVAEHHFTNYASVPSPMVYLAALAQRTERIRLGSMAVVLPLHNPLVVAEEIAMVDQLSGGRLEVGFARGFARYEFEGLNVSLEESKSSMAEMLDILFKLWSGPDADHVGESWKFEPRTVCPQVLQAPHPGLWYACGSETSIDLALERGMDVIQALGIKGMGPAEKFASTLTALCSSRGIDRSTVRYGAQVPTHICHDSSELDRAVNQARWMYRIAGRLTANTQQVVGSFIDDSGTEPFADDIPVELLTSANLIGDARHAQEVVARLQAIGVTDLSLNFDFGDFTSKERKESMREVAELFELT
jgi:alkanesulfonate monooxygenase SsuD/methylene tetrahydromethanopterin reductase-like flavin-dependent oxidoreductase (luciferase family)